MVEKTRADDRGRATESKFYLPAGVTPSSEASWFESVRTALFGGRN
jgi:hypothetical protein